MVTFLTIFQIWATIGCHGLHLGYSYVCECFIHRHILKLLNFRDDWQEQRFLIVKLQSNVTHNKQVVFQLLEEPSLFSSRYYLNQRKHAGVYFYSSKLQSIVTLCKPNVFHGDQGVFQSLLILVQLGIHLDYRLGYIWTAP